MAGNQQDRQTDISVKNATAPATPADKATSNPKAANIGDADGVWADQKATANAKHDRAAASFKGESPGDALAVGGGQQSTPYQLETQADAIAKQTRRGNV